MDYKYLPAIHSPEDVKKISENELNGFCSEIRSCLIDTISKNGGHLSSNLGVVELTVALHRCFDSPDDSILFDVGHQCYTHKLLTGRYDNFPTIRTEDGLSGFMRPDESPHDPFVTGHSSNSISASFGIYKAKMLSNTPGYCISVVGDGAMTGGMVFEALNNAGGSKVNFIVILNDNKMSISKNIGALARHLNKIRINPSYHRFKFKVKKALEKIPLVGYPLFKLLFRSKTFFKDALYHSNLFESMGFNYIGPVDGHNIEKLEKAFSIAKMQTGPVFIHVMTVKGKGYPLAEKMPDEYHGVPSFDIEEGTKPGGKSYSTVAGKTLCELAEHDDKICAITAAMPENTGLSDFAKRFRNRFFDVGIAEEHAVTFCGGLAAGGMKPAFAVFSTFLQRGYDQLIHDISIMGQKVVFLVDRAGIVGEDGVTHQGLYDVAYLSTAPGMTVYSPSCYKELKADIHKAFSVNGPCAVRYPRGAQAANMSKYKPSDEDFVLYEDNDKGPLIITYGRIFSYANEAINAQKGINVLKLNKIFPISNKIIEIIARYDSVHFFEEGIRCGGIAEKLGALIAENGIKTDYHIHAVKDGRVEAASVTSALKKLHLDTEAMLSVINGETK